MVCVVPLAKLSPSSAWRSNSIDKSAVSHQLHAADRFAAQHAASCGCARAGTARFAGGAAFRPGYRPAFDLPSMPGSYQCVAPRSTVHRREIIGVHADDRNTAGETRRAHAPGGGKHSPVPGTRKGPSPGGDGPFNRTMTTANCLLRRFQARAPSGCYACGRSCMPPAVPH